MVKKRLVADDEEIIRNLAEKILKIRQFKVSTTANGKEALALPNIVKLDKRLQE